MIWLSSLITVISLSAFNITQTNICPGGNYEMFSSLLQAMHPTKLGDPTPEMSRLWYGVWPEWRPGCQNVKHTHMVLVHNTLNYFKVHNLIFYLPLFNNILYGKWWPLLWMCWLRYNHQISVFPAKSVMRS